MDSCVNMAVLGKHCWTISRSKQSVDVRAVANDVGGIKIYLSLKHFWLMIEKEYWSPTC